MSVASPTPSRARTTRSRSTTTSPASGISMRLPLRLPAARNFATPSSPLRPWSRARSSAGEHYVDIVGVTGSIPVAPTTRPPSTLLRALAGKRSAAEFGGEVDEIVGDFIEIVLGLEVSGLVGAVFEGPADEGGVEAAAARRDEIAIVRRHHHALLGPEIEQRGAAVVGLGLWLVGVRHLRAEDDIPRQAGMFGHVDHQRDVAVR